MFRNLIRWSFAILAGGIVWVASSGTAKAQFFPGYGAGFSPFMGAAMWGNPYMMGSFNRSFVNPYTGGVFNYQYSPYGGVSGYSMFNPFTGRSMSYSAYIPYYAAMGYGGGYAAPVAGYGYGATTTGGAYGSSSNRITNEQLRILRAASYRNSPGYSTDTGSAYGARPAVDRQQKATPSDKPANINRDLLDATDAEIESGQALNALVTEIRNLHEKGAKVEAPLLPLDIVEKLYYKEAGSGELVKPTALPKWPSTGATVTELIRHLDSNKVVFAAAPHGAEGAYGATYRGFSGYYVALAQAKK